MEKAKAFFLICAGILMLTIAMNIGTESARADFDPDAGGPIVSYSTGYCLLTNGECWAPSLAGWARFPNLDPPVPLSEIAFWETTQLITTNGDYWEYNGATWTNFGGPPEGTPASSSNWSQLKGSYGK